MIAHSLTHYTHAVRHVNVLRQNNFNAKPQATKTAEN